MSGGCCTTSVLSILLCRDGRIDLNEWLQYLKRVKQDKVSVAAVKVGCAE